MAASASSRGDEKKGFERLGELAKPSLVAQWRRHTGVAGTESQEAIVWEAGAARGQEHG